MVTSFKNACYRTVGKDIYSFKPHSERHVVLLQPWTSGGYFLVDGRILPIRAGSVYLINGLMRHCSNPLDVQKYTRSKLVVDYDFFVQTVSLFGLEERIRPILEDGANACLSFAPEDTAPLQIDRLFRQAQAHFAAGGPLATALLGDLTVQLLLMLPEAARSPDGRAGKSDRVLDRITAYLNEKPELWGDFSLDRMCRELHISKSYACHRFKQSTGLSVMRYLNHLRIAQAEKFLLETDLKVCEIAALLGYANSPLFCRAFKKTLSCSPAKFRANAPSGAASDASPDL